MNTPLPRRAPVVIVGGGIAGLSTAWYLQQQGVPYTLVEADNRWGGKIKTDFIDGYGDQPFVVEAGADSFLTQKPWAWQLARDLGLKERFLGTNNAQRRVYVLDKGKLTPLPEGLLLIVPTRFMPFVRSPLISLRGKLRMGLDLIIPAKRDGKDESLADFVRRRLGQEALDKIAEPLMAGIYNAEAERQSLLATFPRLRAIEEKHGSLIRGMLSAMKNRPPGPANSDAPASVFVSLRGGVAELVETLVDQLSGDLRLNCAVESVARNTQAGYSLTLHDDSQLEAGALVLATPAYTSASLLFEIAPEAARKLAAIRYVSTGTLSLAYRREDIPHVLDGFGLVIPASEQRRINAITWTSAKFNHRAPEGHALLRIFFGGSRHPDVFAQSDERIRAIARQELGDIMGITAAPLFDRLYRWPNANPQYDLGHLDHIDAIEAALPSNLYLTGSAFRGIGIPDCIHQGQQTAAHIMATQSQSAMTR